MFKTQFHTREQHFRRDSLCCRISRRCPLSLFYLPHCRLVFSSSPSHSLLITQLLMLFSCCQQELLALTDSQRSWPPHFSCLFSRPIPPSLSSLSLGSPPFSTGSSASSPVATLLPFLFYLIPRSIQPLLSFHSRHVILISKQPVNFCEITGLGLGLQSIKY